MWRDYGLVPIAYEDYGGSLVNLGTEVNAYYAVAVARRRDSYLTLFNLKRTSLLRADCTDLILCHEAGRFIENLIEVLVVM